MFRSKCQNLILVRSIAGNIIRAGGTSDRTSRLRCGGTGIDPHDEKAFAFKLCFYTLFFPFTFSIKYFNTLHAPFYNFLQGFIAVALRFIFYLFIFFFNIDESILDIFFLLTNQMT